MFKEGDRVIRTGGDFGNVRQGKTYSVLFSNDFNVWLVGIREAYAKNKFKLAEDEKMETIKITKWEDLDGKKNGIYELSGGYDDVIYIHLRKTAARIHVICLEDSRKMILSVFELFGFSVSFTEPIKLTKKQWNFVRSVDDGYFSRRMGRLRFNIEKRDGADAQSWMHFDEIIDFPFIQEGEERSIESLRELECEEEP